MSKVKQMGARGLVLNYYKILCYIPHTQTPDHLSNIMGKIQYTFSGNRRHELISANSLFLLQTPDLPFVSSPSGATLWAAGGGGRQEHSVPLTKVHCMSRKFSLDPA